MEIIDKIFNSKLPRYELPVCESCLTPLSIFDIKRVMKDRRIINNEDRKEKFHGNNR